MVCRKDNEEKLMNHVFKIDLGQHDVSPKVDGNVVDLSLATNLFSHFSGLTGDQVFPYCIVRISFQFIN